jgi:hypothetical protein
MGNAQAGMGQSIRRALESGNDAFNSGWGLNVQLLGSSSTAVGEMAVMFGAVENQYV